MNKLDIQTDIRIKLHKYVYLEYIDMLANFIENECDCSIKDINYNNDEMKIDLLIDTEDTDLERKINRGFNNFINCDTIKPMLLCEVPGELIAEYDRVLLECSRSLYNMTVISVLKPNDTIIILL